MALNGGSGHTDAMTEQQQWARLGDELTTARGSLKRAPVARALGISSTQLANYEKGDGRSGRPSAERIVRMALKRVEDGACGLAAHRLDAGLVTDCGAVVGEGVGAHGAVDAVHDAPDVAGCVLPSLDARHGGFTLARCCPMLPKSVA